MDRNQILQAAFTGELHGEKVSIDKATRELIDEEQNIKNVDAAQTQVRQINYQRSAR